MGPFVAMLLIAGVGLFSGYTNWFLLITFFVVYRLGQDYVLQPMLLSAGMRIHPLLIIFGYWRAARWAGFGFPFHPFNGGAAPDFPAIMEAGRFHAAIDKAAAAPQLPPPSPPAGGEGKKRLGVIGTIVALLLKFKTRVCRLLTKGKLVLLGLTKLNTLLSMLLSIGVYWALYGWKFGLGFVLSIYAQMRWGTSSRSRYGIPASSPMFIPLVGAFVRLKAYPASAGEDARVGLGGAAVWLGSGAGVHGDWRGHGFGFIYGAGESGASTCSI